MITPDQIRAARGLKDWSQSVLAKKSGLATPTIANIEAGKQEPGRSTLEKIVAAFEAEDIEFLASDGIRKRRSTIRTFHGRDECLEFYNFVYEFAHDVGGLICVKNGNNYHQEDWFPGFYQSDYAKNMMKICDRFDSRILIREGDNYFPAPYMTYRWAPESKYATIPFQVFGDYLAIFLFLDEPIIILIKNKESAELYRGKFLLQWDDATIPPGTKG